MQKEKEQQVHQLRILNASLRLDKQKLKTKVDLLNETVVNLKIDVEQTNVMKDKLHGEVDRLQEIALA